MFLLLVAAGVTKGVGLRREAFEVDAGNEAVWPDLPVLMAGQEPGSREAPADSLDERGRRRDANPSRPPPWFHPGEEQGRAALPGGFFDVDVDPADNLVRRAARPPPALRRAQPDRRRNPAQVHEELPSHRRGRAIANGLRLRVAAGNATTIGTLYNTKIKRNKSFQLHLLRLWLRAHSLLGFAFAFT